MHLGTFTGPAGTSKQRTELTARQRDILNALLRAASIRHPVPLNASTRGATNPGDIWLLHVLGGSGSGGPGVELADDEVDHRDEVAVGAVPTGSAFRGLDQRVEALQESV
jgi:hypothetical protein